MIIAPPRQRVKFCPSSPKKTHWNKLNKLSHGCHERFDAPNMIEWFYFKTLSRYFSLGKSRQFLNKITTSVLLCLNLQTTLPTFQCVLGEHEPHAKVLWRSCALLHLWLNWLYRLFQSLDSCSNLHCLLVLPKKVKLEIECQVTYYIPWNKKN